MKINNQLKIALLWVAIIAFIVFLCFFWSFLDKMQSENSMISEVTAISIAQETVQEKLTEEDWDYDIFDEQTEIKVDALEDRLVYQVIIHTGDAETNEWMRTFRVWVDLYEGTVIDMDFSQ